MKRARAEKKGEEVVSETKLRSLFNVISDCNAVEGPIVSWDMERHCFGLRAEKKYKAGERITTYGGTRSSKPINGDYVAKAASDCFIDGRVGFKLKEKGRWINESDRTRSKVNAKLGRNVKALTDIEEDEWIFVDYGKDYKRTY